MHSTDQNELAEQEERLKEKMSRIRNVLIVMSGKGGVGKSSVAVNLAYALSLSGKAVGIFDVDFHGPNIAKMLGIENEKIYSEGSEIKPVEVSQNLKAMSLALIGYHVDQPIIWRGPMKASMIRQLLADVKWGDLDYMIIDSPPGTGDEPLSVCQLIPKLSGAIIVTTPQEVAVMDARKSINFAYELKIPVVGVIENMSGFVCPHCHTETNIFKKGGGEQAAEELDVPFLGSVPLDPQLVELGDNGTPFVSFKERSAAAEHFMEIVKKIEDFTKG